MNLIKKGIILRLSGGLGNQMLQFYFASRMAKNKDLPLYLDLSWFNKKHLNSLITLRKFELDCFNLNFSFEIFNSNIFYNFYLFFFGKRIKSSIEFLSLYRNDSFDLFFIDYHCCDLDVDSFEFKELFKWKEYSFSNQLLMEYHNLKKSHSVGVFLRKDDWIRLSPKNVVNENCFENEIMKLHPLDSFVVGQIGDEPINFNKIKIKKIYQGDCGVGWVSFEKMYLLSAMKFLYTSNSTYGRCALYLTESGDGKIVDPCQQ